VPHAGVIVSGLVGHRSKGKGFGGGVKGCKTPSDLAVLARQVVKNL
jgi:hypothetical protein